MNANFDQNVDLTDLTKQLLEALDARSKDVVSRRYGIGAEKAETLESIGREYGITRERVRQIQSQAKKNLQSQEEYLAPAQQLFHVIFRENGGVLAEEQVVTLVQEQLAKPVSARVVNFYLDVLSPYAYVVRSTHFAPHWRDQGIAKEETENAITTAQSILEKHTHPVDEAKLLRSITEQLETAGVQCPDAHVLAHLIASKRIQKTPFSQWGLDEWAETNPRGVGDKAYVVLRRHGKPEHFTEITNLINEAQFSPRQANPQTVHNELIKDNRFVLVGRGLYGLVEWGYMTGTVTDVIASLLEKSEEPLSRDEVIEQVLEQRHVKKNTILLGLQNQERFARTDDARYTLKK